MQIILVIVFTREQTFDRCIIHFLNVVILGPSRRVRSGGGYRRKRYHPCDLTVPVPVPVPGSNIFFFSAIAGPRRPGYATRSAGKSI